MAYIVRPDGSISVDTIEEALALRRALLEESRRPDGPKRPQGSGTVEPMPGGRWRFRLRTGTGRINRGGFASREEAEAALAAVVAGEEPPEKKRRRNSSGRRGAKPSVSVTAELAALLPWAHLLPTQERLAFEGRAAGKAPIDIAKEIGVEPGTVSTSFGKARRRLIAARNGTATARGPARVFAGRQHKWGAAIGELEPGQAIFACTRCKIEKTIPRGNHPTRWRHPGGLEWFEGLKPCTSALTLARPIQLVASPLPSSPAAAALSPPNPNVEPLEAAPNASPRPPISALRDDALRNIDERDRTPTSSKSSKKTRSVGSVEQSALAAYMNGLRHCPLMTREEEHEVATRYMETRDPGLAKRLVTANLRLVVMIAKECKRSWHDLLDLIQEGNAGLIHAVEKYDPGRGAKLSTYASDWIRAYIMKFIMSSHSLVKLGTTQSQRMLFYKVRKAREGLEKFEGEVSAARVAESLGVAEKQVVEMEQRLHSPETSLDVLDEDGRAHGPRLLPAPEDARPDRQAESAEFRELLRSKIWRFEATKLKNDRERAVFHDRMFAEEPATLVDIADRFGVTRERVRQIEERIKKRLREYLKQCRLVEHGIMVA